MGDENDNEEMTEGGEERSGGQAPSETATDPRSGPSDSAPTLGELAAGTLGSMLGELVLHFPNRDVTIAVDDRAASSMIDLYQRRKNASSEPFIPGISDMHNAWIALDLNGVLAISWWPGVPTLPCRAVIDPVVSDRSKSVER